MHAINIQCDEHTQSLLETYFEKHKIGHSVGFTKTQASHIQISSAAQIKSFNPPARLGEILDYISLCAKNANNAAFIHFDGAILNTQLGIFTPTDQEGISLTEKEVEILTFLSRHNNQSVSRDMLLGTVWGYAKDVETHTLETHVYRLRQKIERNPAEPQFLQTAEDGYLVKVLK